MNPSFRRRHCITLSSQRSGRRTAFYRSQLHSDTQEPTAPTFLHGYQYRLLQRLNGGEEGERE